MDTGQVLEEIKKGNSEAFKLLFKAYYPRLLGYALRFIQNEEEAKDLVQECFAVFWEKREHLNSVSLASLLFTIVRNSCLNYLKHNAIVKKHRIDYLVNVKGEERLYYSDFLLDADKKILFDELQEQINSVIDSLPQRCREVFILSRFEGLKNREIAEQLSISTTAVEKHIAKAVSSFSKHFKTKYPTEIYLLVLSWLLLQN